MNEEIDRLLLAYGKHDLAAVALGYSERQYRNIRQKVAKGESLPPRIVGLINLKLQQIENGLQTETDVGAPCARR